MREKEGGGPGPPELVEGGKGEGGRHELGWCGTNCKARREADHEAMTTLAPRDKRNSPHVSGRKLDETQ